MKTLMAPFWLVLITIYLIRTYNRLFQNPVLQTASSEFEVAIHRLSILSAANYAALTVSRQKTVQYLLFKSEFSGE